MRCGLGTVPRSTWNPTGIMEERSRKKQRFEKEKLFQNSLGGENLSRSQKYILGGIMKCWVNLGQARFDSFQDAARWGEPG